MVESKIRQICLLTRKAENRSGSYSLVLEHRKRRLDTVSEQIWRILGLTDIRAPIRLLHITI